MSDVIEWRWADVDGTEHVVRFDQLSDAFSSKALPPFTLVWRTGWTEWLSATNVAELTAAVGMDDSGPPSVVRPNPTAVTPPKPPIARYAAHLPAPLPTTLMRASKATTPPAPRKPLPPPRPIGAGGLPRPGGGPQPPRQIMPPPKPPGAPPRRMTPPQGTPQPPGIAGAPVPNVPPPPEFALAPIPIRDVQPTLAEEEPARSPTLRPSGALPPPPRALPQQTVPRFDLEPPRVPGDRDSAPDSVDLDPTVPMPAAVDIPPPPFALAAVAQAVSAPPPLPETPAPPPLANLPAPPPLEPGMTPLSSTPAVSAATPRRGPKAPVSAKPGPSRQIVTMATAASVLIPGTVLLVAALMKPPSRTADGATAAPSARAQSGSAAPSVEPRATAEASVAAPRAATPADEAPSKSRCSLAHAAVRLAPAAFVGVPVLLTTSADGKKVLAGFAGAKERASGISIVPDALSASTEYDSATAGGALLGVVPLASGSKVAFATDLADPTFSFARTVDAAAPFTIGVTEAGFSRKAGSDVSVIWPGQSENPTITTPRVASARGTGHVVAFRHGGQEGKVLAGWLDETGSKRTDLKAVETEAKLVGTPTVAVNRNSVLVAFAAKSKAEDPWRVELGTAVMGATPERSKAFEAPAGGPSGDFMSPAIEGLPKGRFLLQWTEGSAGNRAVRAQVVSADLVPLGDAITLSTAEQNAGQGAVWVNGDQALAVFLVQAGTSHELWGASLACP